MSHGNIERIIKFTTNIRFMRICKFFIIHYGCLCTYNINLSMANEVFERETLKLKVLSSFHIEFNLLKTKILLFSRVGLILGVVTLNCRLLPHLWDLLEAWRLRKSRQFRLLKTNYYINARRKYSPILIILIFKTERFQSFSDKPRLMVILSRYTFIYLLLILVVKQRLP